MNGFQLGFIRRSHDFSPQRCHANALRFSTERFIREFSAFVSRQQGRFEEERRVAGAYPDFPGVATLDPDAHIADLPFKVPF